MPSIVEQLNKKNLIHPPPFLSDNVHYEVIMGSFAYGVSSDTSDMDVYGFAIPPKEVIFPHLNGHILGFGKQPPKFEVYQEHHIVYQVREYDLSIYNIIKFFQLCMENNPNMVDALFVPVRCIIHSTAIGQMVRENRRLFLHKGCWPKFKGYAYSQLHKAITKNPEGKRKEIVEKYGYDVKFAYHVVRLMDEVEQILTLGDLDLERAKDILKSIRNGEWTFEKVQEYFNIKEKGLERAYEESTLPWGPYEEAIKQLLLNCLEHHYGNLAEAVRVVPDVELVMKDFRAVMQKWGF